MAVVPMKDPLSSSGLLHPQNESQGKNETQQGALSASGGDEISAGDVLIAAMMRGRDFIPRMSLSTCA